MQNLAYRSTFDLALQAARKLAATELENRMSCFPKILTSSVLGCILAYHLIMPKVHFLVLARKVSLNSIGPIRDNY